MPPRDEKLPLDVLRRVMPRKPPAEEPPRDPTLLEVFTDSFINDRPKTRDESEHIKDDGKRR